MRPDLERERRLLRDLDLEKTDRSESEKQSESHFNRTNKQTASYRDLERERLRELLRLRLRERRLLRDL